MKIIDASPWEMRNLRMNAWEVTLDRSDLTDVLTTIEKLHDSRFDGAYVCIKVPVGNLRIVHALEDDGFRFVETQISLVDTFEPSSVLNYAGELGGRIGTRVVPKVREEWERVIVRITPGMFDTDRIALDPAFGEDVSCRRYQNWCRDLFDNPDSRMVVTTLDDDDAAFGVHLVKENGDYQGVLGGVFAEFKSSGLGAILIPDAKNRKSGEKQRTVVSSNNISVFRLHQNSGRTVYKELYVLRKIYK